MPMILTVAGISLFAKLFMMYDESRSQELIERKVKNAPAVQGSVRMLTREEWKEFRQIHPRTPFESKLARPNAKIRTGARFNRLTNHKHNPTGYKPRSIQNKIFANRQYAMKGC